jgi:hypothetical protein
MDGHSSKPWPAGGPQGCLQLSAITKNVLAKVLLHPPCLFVSFLKINNFLFWNSWITGVITATPGH